MQAGAEADGLDSGHLLVDRDLAGLIADGGIAASHPIAPSQIQSASLDLRLAGQVRRIRAGFLPGPTPVERRLAELEVERASLAEGARLEPGCVYLALLEERLALPDDLAASFNPRSTTGRCDVFTRVLVPGHPRFNEAPAGYHGPLWLEIAPLSFPVRLARGDRLCQMRIAHGRSMLSTHELRHEYERHALCFVDGAPVPPDQVCFAPEGGLQLHVGLAGREPAGWRARADAGEIEFGREGAHAAHSFWEAVQAEAGHCTLAPGHFTLFASRERVRIPPHLAAEMIPVDVDIGEMRNNYAGFFDPGFGWGAGRQGTPAVLEVRAHDIPFLVEEGQVFFRLCFHRTSAPPERLYAQGRAGGSYEDQDLTLARLFRDP
jgi:dCTP deaminase